MRTPGDQGLYINVANGTVILFPDDVPWQITINLLPADTIYFTFGFAHSAAAAVNDQGAPGVGAGAQAQKAKALLGAAPEMRAACVGVSPLFDHTGAGLDHNNVDERNLDEGPEQRDRDLGDLGDLGYTYVGATALVLLSPPCMYDCPQH